MNERWSAHRQLQSKLRVADDSKEFPGLSVVLTAYAAESQEPTTSIDKETLRLWSAVDRGQQCWWRQQRLHRRPWPV
jgi:hypothetical protein